MRSRPTASATVTVVCSLWLAEPALACQYEVFQHAPTEIGIFLEKHRTGVVEVKSAERSGTAFLIDDKAGLLLTAGHVIGGLSVGDKVTLRSEPSARRADATAEVYALADNAIDVALLRVVGENPFGRTEAIELSFDNAIVPQRAGFIGASKSDKTAQLEPRQADSVNRLVASRENVYTITASTDAGDSGSPVVFNNSNLANGIVIESQTPRTAVVLPTTAIVDFLTHHAVEPPLEFEQLSASYVEAQFLTYPLGSKEYSNWRLIGFLKKLDKMARERDAVERALTEFQGCSLIEMSTARQLGRTAIRLAVLIEQKFAALSDRALGTRLLQYGDRVKQTQNTEMAGMIYLEAANSFGRAAKATLTGADKLAANEDGLFFLSGIGPDELKVISETTGKSDVLSGVLLDYQVALARADASRAFSLDPQAMQLKRSETLLASALGIEAAVDGKWRALHFQEAGNVLFALKQYNEASGAYAGAWVEGMKTDTIATNFKLSRKLFNPDLEAASESIYNFKPLTTGTLFEANIPKPEGT